MIRRCLRLAIFGLLILPLMAGVWWWRAPLLTGIANQWIVADSPVKADAIVILGGGVDTRPAAAAKLYREGWTKQILVFQPERTLAVERGIIQDEATVARKILESEQVPKNAITVIKQVVTSTFDEASAVTAWANEHHARYLLVPTNLFHTRRTRWIFSRSLKEAGVEVCIIPVPSPNYTAANWWQSEQGMVDFQNEMLKYVWYLCRY